jgi:tetratricopeptide (TPR) repeat protein
MIKTSFLITLIFFSKTILISQDQIPIPFYDFKNDKSYQTDKLNLINDFNKTNSLEILDEIIKLGFQFKDWETVINFSQKGNSIEESYFRYFNLGAASGFRSREVSKIIAIPYVNIMKYAFLKCLSLKPLDLLALRALLEVYLKIPVLLGGSLKKSYNFADKIIKIDLLEGYLALGYIEEYIGSKIKAKNHYKSALDVYTENYKKINKIKNNYLVNSRRNLIYDLGRALIDYEIDVNSGKKLLIYFLETHTKKDIISKTWIYFNLAKNSIRSGDEDEFEKYYKLALNSNPNFYQIKELR